MRVASMETPLIPRAGLTNIASRAKEVGRSEAVGILLKDTTRNDEEARVDDGQGVTDHDSGGALCSGYPVVTL